MNWKQIVKQVAPGIGTVLGGPTGGMAVKFLAETFLGNGEATEEEVAAAIQNATPDQMLQLRKLDQEFELKLKQLGLDREKLVVDDRKDARQILKTTIWPQVLLSGVFILGYFLVMGLLIGNPAVEYGDRVFGILNTVIGVLTGSIPMILQFWFGSSLGSREKDQRVKHG